MVFQQFTTDQIAKNIYAVLRGYSGVTEINNFCFVVTLEHFVKHTPNRHV